VDCPDSNEWTSFCEGQLPAAEFARLEEHLDRCEECRRVLALLATCSKESVAHGVTASTEPFFTELGPKAQVDSYEIKHLLGRGGMGEAYLAHDRTLRRDVVLKFIRPDAERAEDFSRRLALEARLTAQLNHPNVVTVHGFGQVDDTPYLVLEYVEGETLRDRLSRGALSQSEWKRLARAISSGMAHAHAKGVVHGDLKPSNILLGKESSIKALDFGLARLCRETQASLAASLVDTEESAGPRGTPAYMAPELWLGQPASTASDVWATGLMLWEAAVGKQPTRTSIQDDLARVVRKDEALPGTWAACLSSMLCTEPAHRISMREVNERIEDLTSVGTTGETPVSRRKLLKRPPGSRRAELARKATLLGAFVLVVAFLVGAWFWTRSEKNSGASVAVATSTAPPTPCSTPSARAIPTQSGPRPTADAGKPSHLRPVPAAGTKPLVASSANKPPASGATSRAPAEAEPPVGPQTVPESLLEDSL
jgi:eukaryotic-like serine/threonine-protein kinase